MPSISSEVVTFFVEPGIIGDNRRGYPFAHVADQVVLDTFGPVREGGHGFAFGFLFEVVEIIATRDPNAFVPHVPGCFCPGKGGDDHA